MSNYEVLNQGPHPSSPAAVDLVGADSVVIWGRGTSYAAGICSEFPPFVYLAVRIGNILSSINGSVILSLFVSS